MHEKERERERERERESFISSLYILVCLILYAVSMVLAKRFPK